MKFEIKNRFTGEVRFTCKLDDSFETKSLQEQLGEAIKNAYLDGTNLSGTNLSGANFAGIKEDFINKLILAKNEALGLYDYLMTGKIDGSCYQGECVCFCGTIAKICGQNYKELTNGVKPEADSPTEMWFLAIKKVIYRRIIKYLQLQPNGCASLWIRKIFSIQNISDQRLNG